MSKNTIHHRIVVRKRTLYRHFYAERERETTIFKEENSTWAPKAVDWQRQIPTGGCSQYEYRTLSCGDVVMARDAGATLSQGFGACERP